MLIVTPVSWGFRRRWLKRRILSWYSSEGMDELMGLLPWFGIGALLALWGALVVLVYHFNRRG